MYSYHIFHFPFTWETRSKNAKEKIELDRLIYKGSHWQRIKYDGIPYRFNKQSKISLDREFISPAIGKFLQDYGDINSPVQHFEYLAQDQLNYIIGGELRYILPLEKISLNIYSIGVGILSFFIRNDKYSDEEHILEINQMGRKIMPSSFPTDIERYFSLAGYLGIEGLSHDNMKGDYDHLYIEKFEYSSLHEYQPACFIRNLINNFFSKIYYRPIDNNYCKLITSFQDTSDYMFGMSLYFNNIYAYGIKNQQNWVDTNKFWWKYIMGRGTFCLNMESEENKEWIRKHTITRNRSQKKLTGITNDFFVELCSKEYYNNKAITNFWEEIEVFRFEQDYNQLVCSFLLQKMSIQRLMNSIAEITNVQNTSFEKVPSLVKYSEFIYYEYVFANNHIFFSDISGTIEGTQIYKMLLQQNDIEYNVEKLGKAVNELNQYATMLESRRQNTYLYYLTLLGGVFLIPSFLTGYFGMNFFQKEQSKLLCIPFVIVVLIMSGLTYLYFSVHQRFYKILILLGIVISIFIELSLTFII